jgi:KUP system potassium uptake protein
LEGQIYVPVVNWLLAAGVVALVLIFRRSSSLAEIYGVAVTGTFILDTILFMAVSRFMWHTAKWKLVLMGAAFLTVELAFFSSNLTKISHGAWIPLSAGVIASLVMLTWRRGREIVTRNRADTEGSLQDFLYRVRMADPPLHRVGSVAIYLSPDKLTTPLALKAEVDHSGVFHDKVLIVSIDMIGVPHVDPGDKFDVETLGAGLFKIQHIMLRSGYRDSLDVPAALGLARKRGLLQRNLDLEHASYFLSRITITPTRDKGMDRWRKSLFTTMARNAASPIEQFSLPVNRTVTVGAQIAV